jgi:hypothetical protein
MINSNERNFTGAYRMCGGSNGEFKCPRLNNHRNNNFNEPQGFCTYSRNNFYSPEVNCFTSEVSGSFNEFDTPDFTVNLSNFRVRFEKIDDLIK